MSAWFLDSELSTRFSYEYNSAYFMPSIMGSGWSSLHHICIFCFSEFIIYLEVIQDYFRMVD